MESLCARCARHQQTCCQGTEVFVTLGDVTRIKGETGRADFHEFHPPDNPIYGEQDDDPVWRDHVFGADGSRRVLKHQPNDDCTFLGPQGCTLSPQARPLVCRLFPFDYTSEGIRIEPAAGCPLELLLPAQGLLETLDMKLADAERWRSQLYAELMLERELALP